MDEMESCVWCDICGLKFTEEYKGALYGCRDCDYDCCCWCVVKLMGIVNKTCRNGHPLSLAPLDMRLRGKRYTGIICDVCEKDISLKTHPAKYPILRCKMCDYDICPECAAKKK